MKAANDNHAPRDELLWFFLGPALAIWGVLGIVGLTAVLYLRAHVA